MSQPATLGDSLTAVTLAAKRGEAILAADRDLKKWWGDLNTRNVPSGFFYTFRIPLWAGISSLSSKFFCTSAIFSPLWTITFSSTGPSQLEARWR
jgi:hypothetical protein